MHDVAVCVEWLFHFSQHPSVFLKIVPCCIATHTHFCVRVAQYRGLRGINPWGTSGMRWPMILGQVWAGGEETRIPLFLLDPTSPLWPKTPLPHSQIALNAEPDNPAVHFCSCSSKIWERCQTYSPLDTTVLTSEEKCPFAKTIFPCTLAKNLFGGLCRWRGDRRKKKCDWGMKQQVRGNWMPSTLHTTRLHSRLKEARAKDAQTLAKAFASKEKPLNAAHRSVFCTHKSSRFAFFCFSLVKTRVSAQLPLPVIVIAQKFRLGRALPSSQALLCFCLFI